jgi:hypothetical protein
MALLQAEGRVTLADGILATAVLVALALKAVIGWWWADPLPGMCSSSAPPGRHVRSSPALTNAINKMANAARPAAGLRTCTGRTTRNRAPNRNVYWFNRHCWFLPHVSAVRAHSSRPLGTSLTGRAMRRASASKLGLPIIPWGPRRIGLVAE